MCILLSLLCLGCQGKDSFSALSSGCEEEDSITDKDPDKIIESTSGVLHYHEGMKMWSVHHVIPGTIDSVEIYLMTEIPDVKFSFDEGKQVSLSGSCYKIAPQELLDLAIAAPAGTELYYIKVTNLI
jgi:hypothetical protein